VRNGSQLEAAATLPISGASLETNIGRTNTTNG
jgi:hypothetical protein